MVALVGVLTAHRADRALTLRMPRGGVARSAG